LENQFEEFDYVKYMDSPEFYLIKNICKSDPKLNVNTAPFFFEDIMEDLGTPIFENSLKLYQCIQWQITILSKGKSHLN